tara:strand:+ start:1083 stop:1256 length:174 start_codon:yes stop_codon:yes gene_type:complete
MTRRTYSFRRSLSKGVSDNIKHKIEVQKMDAYRRQLRDRKRDVLLASLEVVDVLGRG